MPKVSQEHRDAQRRRIHDAALSVYAARGFTRATMADIIEASGLSAGAIYGYYQGKDDIRDAVAAEILRDRSETLRLAAQQETPAPPVEVLTALMKSIPTPLLDSGMLLQLWGEPGSEAVVDLAHNALATLEEAFVDYLRAWLVSTGLDRRSARRKAQRMAPAMMGLAQGYIVQTSLLGPERGRAYLASLGALL